ncbi:hypothetical protein F4774DRAFT_138077 [Daldinia eschscholtzii]|nr:hypothetical protein F4774DRAFT_138077 [Daldinia eschscholtzii]
MQKGLSNAIMNDTIGEPGVSLLVRKYSLRAEQETPNSILSKALGTTSRNIDDEEERSTKQLSDWKKWLQNGDIPDGHNQLGALEKQRKEVIEMWQQFHHLFPAWEEPTLARDGVPTIATLRDAVQEAQISWGRKSKTRNRLFMFLEALDDHSYLFKLIPTEDKYLSLLTGVISSIVKASVNYNKIADGFSQALSEMTADLRTAGRKMEIEDGPDMQKLVSELYVQVFQFLCHAMSYFRKRTKRLRSALNKHFYEKNFKTMVDGIRTTIQKIQQEAAHATEGRIRGLEDRVIQVDYKLDQVLPCLKAVGNESRDDDENQIGDKLILATRFVSLGNRAFQHLEAVQAHCQYDEISDLRHHALLLPGIEDIEVSSTEESNRRVESDESTSSDEINETDLRTRYEIQEYASRLSPYIEDGRKEVSNTPDRVSRELLPAEVILELQNWLGAVKSRMIWVEGMPANSYSSDLSLAARRLVDISLSANIPCISFFVKPRYDFASRVSPPMPQRQAAVVALLYSIITQLACLLPVEFENLEELEEAHFQKLDGSFGSVPFALQVVRALLKYAPPSLIWVLDGFQLTESQDTIPHLRTLISILRDQEANCISKVCFTTDGNCMVLSRTMNVLERVEASRTTQGRPGNLLRGGSDINTLGFSSRFY